MPEGVGDPPGGGESVHRKVARPGSSTDNAADEAFYKPFIKPGYKRVFPENAGDGEFTVFVQSSKEEKIGNRNPLVMANLFKSDIKGVVNIKRINANKMGVIFKQANNANNFIKNEDWLNKNNLKAYIPSHEVETIGVLRFVPISISNEELFKKLSSQYEIISVRRFTKRENGEIKPFGSVSITFLSRSLPECVYLDIYRFRVYEYVAPLLQCFKCMKFNHAAKFCNGTQICSICSETHHYSACTNPDLIKCINCSGPHLAISRDCPIKKRKMEEKRNRVSYASALRGTHQNNIVNNYDKDFPAMTHKRAQPSNPIPVKQIPAQPQLAKTSSTQSTSKSGNNNGKDIPTMSKTKLINEILTSDSVLNVLVASLVALGNSNGPCTMQSIRETLINQFKNG